MSKTKTALPEDMDITDDREPDYGPVDEPSAVDYALNDLHRVLTTLEQNAGPLSGYADELEQYTKRLQRVLKTARKPF